MGRYAGTPNPIKLRSSITIRLHDFQPHCSNLLLLTIKWNYAPYLINKLLKYLRRWLQLQINIIIATLYNRRLKPIMLNCRILFYKIRPICLEVNSITITYFIRTLKRGMWSWLNVFQCIVSQVDGRELICLPQAFELFLKHLVGGLHTVYTKLKRLDITPVVCNVEQVRILRGLGAIQPGVNRCKLISPREFDVLYEDCTNSR